MSVDHEGYLIGVLKRLGMSHPDRELFEKQLAQTQRHNRAKREASPKLDLRGEWERQVARYIKLGFHEVLGIDEVSYRDSLPKFTPQPEAFKGRFDIPVLVETRISVSKQTELVGSSYLLGGLKVQDWKGDPKGYKTPKALYTTWMQDGSEYLKLSVVAFRERMNEDERGATEFDGIALIIKNPEILKHHYINLPGTSVGFDDAPFLRLWFGEPVLDNHWVVGARSNLGSASCGR